MEIKKIEEIELIRDLLEFYLKGRSDSVRAEIAKNLLWRVNDRLAPKSGSAELSYLKGVSEKTVLFFKEYQVIAGKNLYHSIQSVLSNKPQYDINDLLNYYKQYHSDFITKHEEELKELILHIFKRIEKKK